MKLTPLDIRHKEFKRVMRGYADVEVDEFLDEVAEEFERVFKENIDLHERLEALEEQVAGYKRMEEMLQKTLISAQASAEEIKQNSAKEAQLLVHEAELRSRQLINEAYTERQNLEGSMVQLRAAEQDFRFKFRALLEGYLRQVQETPEIGSAVPAEGPAQVEFESHAEAFRQAIAREAEEVPAAPQTKPTADVDAAWTAPAEPAPRPEAGDAAGAPQPPVDVTAPQPPVAAPGAPTAPAQPQSPFHAALAGMAFAPPADAAAQPDGDAFAGPPADDAPAPAERPVWQATPAAPATPGPSAAGSAPGNERVMFGETDDLMADVDSGVNENEFKW